MLAEHTVIQFACVNPARADKVGWDRIGLQSLWRSATTIEQMALPHCSMLLLQGRVEHKTIEVPCWSLALAEVRPQPSQPSCRALCLGPTVAAPAAAGLVATTPPAAATAAAATISMASSGLEPATFSCSAFIDASSAALPATALLMTQPSAAAASAAAGGDGTRLQEVDVYLPGCPLNSYPAKNKDHHLCIMCGKHCCCSQMVLGPCGLCYA